MHLYFRTLLKQLGLLKLGLLNPIHTGARGYESAPPLCFFSITFEVSIVTPSDFVIYPNFYLSLLWEKIFLENMPKCCLGNLFLSVSKI